jgi:phosphate uptake regulator
MGDVDAHEYRLGSHAASIVGMTQRLLERDDLPDEVVTHLRAIRELALEMLRDAEEAGTA